MTNGRYNVARVRAVCRLPTSMGMKVPARLSSSLDQVKLAIKSKPWESRFVPFNCSELYQVSPSGAHVGLSPELVTQELISPELN